MRPEIFGKFAVWLFPIRYACLWYAVPVPDTLCLFPIRCACSWYAVPVPITVDWLFVVPVAPTNWIFWPWSRFISPLARVVCSSKSAEPWREETGYHDSLDSFQEIMANKKGDPSQDIFRSLQAPEIPERSVANSTPAWIWHIFPSREGVWWRGAKEKSFASWGFRARGCAVRTCAPTWVFSQTTVCGLHDIEQSRSFYYSYKYL